MRSCLDYVTLIGTYVLLIFCIAADAGGGGSGSGYGIVPISSHSGHGGISSTIIIVEDAKGNWLYDIPPKDIAA